MFTCKCELKIFPKPWTMRKKRLRQNDYIFLFGGWLSSKLIFLFSTNIIKFLFLKLELSLHSCRASILGGSRPRQIYPKLGKYYLEDKKLPKFHRFGALCFEFHALMLFQFIWNSSCFLPSFSFFFILPTERDSFSFLLQRSKACPHVGSQISHPKVIISPNKFCWRSQPLS